MKQYKFYYNFLIIFGCLIILFTLLNFKNKKFGSINKLINYNFLNFGVKDQNMSLINTKKKYILPSSNITEFDLISSIFRNIQGSATRVFRLSVCSVYHSETPKPDFSLPYTWENFVSYIMVLSDIVIFFKKNFNHLFPNINILEWENLKLLVLRKDKKIRNKVFKNNNLSWRDNNYSSQDNKLCNFPFDRWVGPDQMNRDSCKRTGQNGKLEILAYSSVDLNNDPTLLKNILFNDALYLLQSEYTETLTIYTQRSNIWNLSTNQNLDYSKQVKIGPINFSWYYLDFYPQLLKACNLFSLPSSERLLDSWFNLEKIKIVNYNSDYKISYFNDLIDKNNGWNSIRNRLYKLKINSINSFNVKTNIFIAYNLLKPYFFSFNKQRERSKECFRGNWPFDQIFTGDLSHYAGFIDIFLNKSYLLQIGRKPNECSKIIANIKTRWRGSIPYFLGTSTWTLFNSFYSLEYSINKNKLMIERELIKYFKRLFLIFIDCYACPNCREHLNNYVIRNGTTSELNIIPNSNAGSKCNYLFLDSCLKLPPSAIIKNNYPNNFTEIDDKNKNGKLFFPYTNIKFEFELYPLEWILLSNFFMRKSNPYLSQNQEINLIQQKIYDITGFWFKYDSTDSTKNIFYLEFFSTPSDKLSFINNFKELRLFIWKLHNSVNSSIFRNEFWYHYFPSPHTIPTRWWPSIRGLIKESELKGTYNINSVILNKYLNIHNIEASLQSLRSELVYFHLNRFKKEDLLHDEFIVKRLTKLNLQLHELLNYLDFYFIKSNFDGIFKFSSLNFKLDQLLSFRLGNEIRDCNFGGVFTHYN